MRILSALLLLFALQAQLEPQPTQPDPAPSFAVTGVAVIDMTGVPLANAGSLPRSAKVWGV